MASGGIGLFVNQSLNYSVLEKTSNEAFQALWVEMSFVDHKNIVCGIISRQHNSPNDFLTYFDRTIEKMVSHDRDVYIIGDFNIDLPSKPGFFALPLKLLSYSNSGQTNACV